jgi:hypothetical protein
MGKILDMVDEPAESGIPSGMPSGTDRYSDRQEYYTVSEAAKVLDISERRVRQIAQDGKVEGMRSEEGWKLFRYSVHDFRDRREAQNPVRAVRGSRETSSEAREWIERVTALERELGRLEGRLELTERAESTLRAERERLLEDLAQERERATQEREKAEEIQRDAEQFAREREEAQEEARRLQEERDSLLAEAAEEAQRLREELEAERSKGFWRRLFGGGWGALGAAAASSVVGRLRMLYELAVALRAEGISDLIYDEDHDLFRFPDGRFAFSKEWADVKALQERGYFGWVLRLWDPRHWYFLYTCPRIFIQRRYKHVAIASVKALSKGL